MELTLNAYLRGTNDALGHASRVGEGGALAFGGLGAYPRSVRDLRRHGRPRMIP